MAGGEFPPRPEGADVHANGEHHDSAPVPVPLPAGEKAEVELRV